MFENLPVHQLKLSGEFNELTNDKNKIKKLPRLHPELN